MCVSTFLSGLCRILERPVPARWVAAADRGSLLQGLRGVSSRQQALAFLSQHFVAVMALPWYRSDILSELCRVFSPTELEEAAIYLQADRLPIHPVGPAFLINRSSYRKEVSHPIGAHVHYYGNWLVHASQGIVEAYDYSHVINEGDCQVALNDVAYLTQPDRVYYSVVAVRQEELSGLDELRLAGRGGSIIEELTRAVPIGSLNLSDSYLCPQQFNGDVLIEENEQWAVVYNHFMGGAYTVMAKVKESALVESLLVGLIPRRLSIDVRKLLRALVADRFVAYAKGNGQLPLELDGERLQVVYNWERDGFVVYGAFADRPYNTVPFFFEYDYSRSLVENLTALQQVLACRMERELSLVD